MVHDLKDSSFQKGEGGGELGWLLDILYLSPDPSSCLSPATPISLWGWRHILELVGEHLNGKSCVIPRHNRKGQTEMGKR